MGLDFSEILIQIRKQCIGCLVGGAVGDALGYAVEFLQYDEIVKKYGEKGIIEYDVGKDNVAKISDDTQMTYFTGISMEKVLFAKDLKKRRKIIINDLYNQYLIWVKGQIEGFDGTSKLSPTLFEHRSPGTTCISALLGKEMGTISHKINNSKGSGGVMRVAPIALISDDDQDRVELMLLGAEAAAITHSHQLGYITASMLVDLIYRIIKENDIEQAVFGALYSTIRLFSKAEYISELKQIIIKAINLAYMDINDEKAINSIGQGWVAEEALAIAIYCSIKHKDSFEKAIVAAVNHGGDSDTTGAITGNIMGALLGYDAIPSKYKEKLELREELEEMGKRLFVVGRNSILTINRMLNE